MPTSNQRLAASAAQLRRWALTADTTAATAPARAGFRARFERQVDALGITDPADHARRVEQLVKAHMTELSRKAAAGRHRPTAA